MKENTCSEIICTECVPGESCGLSDDGEVHHFLWAKH